MIVIEVVNAYGDIASRTVFSMRMAVEEIADQEETRRGRYSTAVDGSGRKEDQRKR